jgi:threonine/homoserine/homoserine lactone efflux protein
MAAPSSGAVHAAPRYAAAVLGIAVLLSLAPGPDNIFVLLLSAMHGTRAGLTVVLGLCTGLLVHTAVVAVGLAALLAASAVAFTVLKIAGALYLVYLAWQAFRAPVGELSTSQMQVKTGKHMYLRGVIMNLTNPKVVIFFLAFLPQFVSPDRGPVALRSWCLASCSSLPRCWSSARSPGFRVRSAAC